MKDDSRYQAIARGAAFLDRKCPGWENKIDLDSLDINNENRCILAQLSHRDYFDGLLYFGLKGFEAAEMLGLAGDDGPTERVMTPIWKALIEERRR